MDEAQSPAEYPKMLYRGGEAYAEGGRAAPHQNTRVVEDAEEEAAAREDGFGDATVPEPEPETPAEQTEPAGDGVAADATSAPVVEPEPAPEPGQDSVAG